MASKRYRSSLIFAIMVLMLASCGKDKAKTPAGNTKVDETVTKKPALPVKPKPKPPKLQLELDDFIKTRVVERCALKGKESKDDARTIAIDQLAGRPYQPQGLVPKPTPTAPKPKVEQAAKAEKKPADPKGTVRTEADSPNGPPKVEAPSGDKAIADPKDSAAQSAPTVTPGGRMALTKQDEPLTSKYDHDLKAAAKWKPYQDRIEKEVQTCLWAPELGLVNEDLVNRYVSAFVEITCLQDKHRDKGGQLDTVAHARAAVEVFERNQF
ncbi:MAG TPA: hypothetical protein DCQ06_07260, partial [Myxococcales bacterium]|nr:hypothetical protein [Myxococcales bacterium]